MEHNSVCLLRKLRKIVKKKKIFHESFTVFLFCCCVACRKSES